MSDIDSIQLKFSPDSLMGLNIVLGLIMFGVALDLKLDDFYRIRKEPKSVLIGIFSQFLLLPFLTFFLALFLNPPPSIALGMILVSSCPGGNVSNFIVHLSKGRTVLSVTMTAISTVVAIFMTPFNITFWSSYYPGAESLLTDVSLDPVSMLGTVFTLLGIPLILGMFVASNYPHLAEKLRKPFKILSIVFFILFIGIAFKANIDHFLPSIGLIFMPVFIQNAMAFLIGYVSAKSIGVSEENARAVSIEVGIQNSGLGLILIFNFFKGLGGMALIAAWWGIWHIIAGMTLAFFWARRPPPKILVEEISHFMNAEEADDWMDESEKK